MSNTKITNQSYFIKRLKDSGYSVWRAFDEYSEADTRCWTVIIDPKVASILCTHYVNAGLFGDETYFELYDGGQYIPNGIKIKTDSIEILINYLVEWGINNKHESYNARADKNEK
jgi:hypothetical protein